jgi:O-antigen/teichoic acid export membrane protein
MKLKLALLHNTGWKLIAMVFTFLSNIIIVRFLGFELSATFFYDIAIFTFVTTILKFGIENSIVYFASRNNENSKKLFSLVVFITIVQTLITFLFYNFLTPSIKVYSLFWLLVFILGNTLLYSINSFYQVKKMYKSLNLINTMVTFLQFALLSIIYFINPNLFGYNTEKLNVVFTIFGVVTLIQLIILVINYSASEKITLSNIDNPFVIKIFKYSVLNFAATVLLFLLLRADFYFVEKYCSIKNLSNYIQAAKFGQMILVFPGLISGVVFPYSINAEQNFNYKIALICRYLSLVFLIGFLFLLIGGSNIYVWMFGVAFDLMFKIILATYLGVFCLAINNVIVSYYEGNNKQLIMLKANVISLLLLLILDYIFVPIYGYLAASIIFTVANLVGMIILLKHYSQISSINMKDFFIIKKSDFLIFKTI